MYDLRIELRSPLCAGSGASGPGYVDRDIVFDKNGLPWLPARRIKGLLREAFYDVSSSLRMQDSTVDFTCTERELFGDMGQASSGVLSFRNALICDPITQQPETRLSEWLSSVLSYGRSNGERLKDGNGGILHREEVLDAFTETRRQTSIERSTGTAAENTLRVTRCVRAGLSFQAVIVANAKLSSGAENLLALVRSTKDRT